MKISIETENDDWKTKTRQIEEHASSNYHQLVHEIWNQKLEILWDRQAEFEAHFLFQPYNTERIHNQEMKQLYLKAMQLHKRIKCLRNQIEILVPNQTQKLGALFGLVQKAWDLQMKQDMFDGEIKS